MRNLENYAQVPTVTLGQFQIPTAYRKSLAGSGNGREHRDRKAPKITVNSAPGKPLNIDMQSIDAVRLMSAFGTAEPGFATLMLSGIINAACGGGPSHPPTCLPCKRYITHARRCKRTFMRS